MNFALNVILLKNVRLKEESKIYFEKKKRESNKG